MKCLDVPSLYICTTPFQIMSSITLAQMKNEGADICIDPQFKNAEKYIENLSREKLFSAVYNAENSKMLLALRRGYKGFAEKTKLAADLFFGKRIYCELVQGKKRYKTIYTSGNNEITRYLMNYVLKKGWNTEIVFFDDGEGSYDSNSVYGFGRKDRTFKSRILMKEIKERPYTYYLYSPEYYRYIHPNTENKIYQLNKWNADRTTMATIERVFELADIEQIPERFILLDTLRNEVFNEQDAEKYKNIINLIITAVGARNICVKKHPRDLETYDGDVRIYGNRSVPFECLIPQFGNDDKVIIALSSTAVFMPKILLEKEYHVILLYRLFQSNWVNEAQREMLYRALINDYHDKSRIMIPESEEELRACLKRITIISE